jgi:hypothetical protein
MAADNANEEADVRDRYRFCDRPSHGAAHLAIPELISRAAIQARDSGFSSQQRIEFLVSCKTATVSTRT